MKYPCIALAALLASSPLLASEPAYTLDNLKAASSQAFTMANTARVWAEATGSKECMKNAHQAMALTADAAIYAFKVSDANDAAEAEKFVRYGMINAKRSVKLSAACLQPNYKLTGERVIPYELPSSVPAYSGSEKIGAYSMEQLQLASGQAFRMSTSAYNYAKETGNKACQADAHEALEHGARASLYAFKASGSASKFDLNKAITDGIFQAQLSVKLAAPCLPPNYQPISRHPDIIQFDRPELEEQSRP